jgi:lipoate-protein ligase A
MPFLASSIFFAMIASARLIDDPPRSAAFNMAADLHLLALCENRPAVVVRIYTWERPSITLGMAEKPGETFDRAALAREKVEWIRRPTGGRSVLHDNDITYSCTCSSGIGGMGATLMETYKVISDCLIAGLTSAGVACTASDSPPDSHLSRSRAKLPCFLSRNRHEIMVSGRKLVGSAQKRTAGAVLQHGSIPLTPAFMRLPDFLQLDNGQRETQKRLLARKCVCMQELVPDLDERTLRDCLSTGFRDTLPFPMTQSPWTEAEIAVITAVAQSEEFRKRWQSADR